MGVNRERPGATFDRIADLYDKARPEYPAELFDDLVELSGIEPRGRILEIGCGTGKATVPLAKRGFELLCLEPGANLAAKAREHLKAFPNARVEILEFEDWDVERGAFDLVFAATSFAWVEPGVRYWKTAAALRHGGCVALSWHAHLSIPAKDDYWVALQDVYRRHAPELMGRPMTPADLPDRIDDGFLDLGLFEEVAVRHYLWEVTYTAEEYVNLLQTFSSLIALPDDVRSALLQDIAELINREFGGSINKLQATVLQIARRIKRDRSS